ncbi:coiled-coil domain-containing protein 27 [Echinops telfairi]|uniref:Coiled-coil domain-containing protein 27 n=1 Tax=Echinops telfairi TaxID=9371 RepID=A0ABM0IQM3_ECHTE|nr:coiled-coil domain-containing protein 27 [Echinops telfairi]
MLPTKEVSPAKRDNAPNTMAKGLASLHCVARRVSKTPEGRCSFHKSKLKEVLDGDTPPSYNGFTSQVDNLRRAFLKRPGCPRFSTRATSMSQYGLSVVAALPRELDVSTEMTEDFSSHQGSDTHVEESLLSFSKSACEFNYLRKRSKSQTTSAVVSSPATVQSPPRKKMPWYISVIHEKDNCLFMLSEEVQRLSELEVQSRRKDEELLILREERETLRRQLKYLFKGKVWETPVSPGLQDSGSPCQDRPGQYMTLEDLQEQFEALKVRMGALQDRFSNLRESKKHEEMMGRIEKDNLLLRQHVMDLEKELTERDHIISEYSTKVQELQSQVDQDQSHIKKQKELQDKLQSMRDQSRQAEQQSRVSLENSQARLERLRNRIIQATFSYSGVKSLVTEISDNDILEALQKVITERNDFYNQLKQKGVKIPTLSQMEGPYSSSSKSKRMALNMQAQVSSIQYIQWKDSGQIEVKAVAEPDIQDSRRKR